MSDLTELRNRIADELDGAYIEADAIMPLIVEAIREAKTDKIVSAIFGVPDKAPLPFALHRRSDVTGVSGTGVVATGVQFPDGTVVIRWAGEQPSTVVWDSIDVAMKVHGHDGKTQVVWLAENLGSEEALREAKAEALREAADEYGNPPNGSRFHPSHIYKWLRDCADEIEEGG